MAAGLIWQSRQPGALEQRIARYRAAGLPTTSAELDAWYLPVPPDQNAAPALLAASATWHTTTNVPLPPVEATGYYPRRGEAWSASCLATVRTELVANARSLAQIQAALERPRSRYPINLDTPVGDHETHMMMLRQAAQNLALAARYAAETGDQGWAASALLGGMRVAQTLEAEPLVNSYHNCLTLKEVALVTAEQVLSRVQLEEDQLTRLQAAFVLAEATNHLDRVIAGERCEILNELSLPTRTLFTGGMKPPEGMEWALLVTVAGLYDLTGVKVKDLLSHLDQLDEIARIAALPRSTLPACREQLETRKRELMGPKCLLHLVSRQKSWYLVPLVTRELSWVTTARCAQAGMAVERWRRTHGGALPSSLNELVPSCLAAVPEDPMDGKPLKYRMLTPAPGYVVYSVGEDGTDDGGKERVSGSGKTNGWDYTFTVNR